MGNVMQNEKVRLIVKILMIALGVFVAIQFILPLIWPVVAGYIVAKTIGPVSEFLCKRLQFNRKVSNLIVLSAFVVVVSIGAAYLGKIFISQIKNLARNWNVIMIEIDGQVEHICDQMERRMDLQNDEIYNLVSDGFYSGIESGRKKLVSIVMNNSVPAFIKTLELFVAMLVAVMSAFFFLRDGEEIKKWVNSYPFAKETKFISEKIKFVFKAYLKAQLFIMLGSSVLCFIGFTIIKNPYSLILAIVLGVVDAIPLLGLGIVVVPWAVICIIAGNTKNGIVLFLTFMLCYILREILEPRLIGEKVGIPPLTSLIAIYAGYKLFGIVGVILGPVAYVVIKESLKVTKEAGEV